MSNYISLFLYEYNYLSMPKSAKVSPTTIAVWYISECKCENNVINTPKSWWDYQMESFSALLAICAGNSPVTGEFPSQRPMTQSFDVFSDLRLNIRLSKQSWGWWFETPSRPLWRQCNVALFSVGLVAFLLSQPALVCSAVRIHGTPFINMDQL